VRETYDESVGSDLTQEGSTEEGVFQGSELKGDQPLLKTSEDDNTKGPLGNTPPLNYRKEGRSLGRGNKTN